VSSLGSAKAGYFSHSIERENPENAATTNGQIFPDNTSQLLRVLSRENEPQKALSPEEISEYREQLLEMAHQSVREVEHGYGLGV
jgi:hypothetical protein